jgi:GNAT superfamily N-acetyltransferase
MTPPDSSEKTLSRQQIQQAMKDNLLVFRTLSEEGNRVQIDSLQRKHFGQWSDVFSSLEKCKGRIIVCLLGKTIIGYQAFEPAASKGNPFSHSKSVMRLTYIVVREDSQVKARHLGIGTELLERTLDLAWGRGYDAVYTYATAYDLMVKAGLRSYGGEEILDEARYVRDFDPDQAPPLLFVVERPENQKDGGRRRKEEEK